MSTMTRHYIPMAVSLPIELKQKIDNDRGNTSLSRFILRIIEDHYDICAARNDEEDDNRPFGRNFWKSMDEERENFTNRRLLRELRKNHTEKVEAKHETTKSQ